ncbi:MAG TPA: TA system VapC family ribonuclease toxin [Bryobacteraceae bacterium]|nr:TA system VapC family ribonuclease toxin [Bryobacteraceae bacterium]
MIAIDTNILVYAHRRDLTQWYEPANARVAELAESGAAWAIPWPCINEFLSVVTNPRIFPVPTPLTQALEQVDYWFECPTMQLLSEAPGYWPELKHLVQSARIAGPAVHDARIFAICRLHGVRELWSADRDFSRFKGVRVVNPLIC